MPNVKRTPGKEIISFYKLRATILIQLARRMHINSSDIEKIEEAIESVRQSAHPNCLFIIRGLPGMGKSYLANFLSHKYQGIHYETDQKFTVGGVYNWDGSKIQAAHELMRHDVKLCMIQQAPLVIVANTGTMRWEYEPYLLLANHYSYTVIVYDMYLQLVEHMRDSLPPLNRTEHNVADMKSNYLEFLNKNNIHEVGFDRIQVMSDRYQFQQNPIEVVAPSAVMESEGSVEAGSGQKYIEVHDTGYYVGIAINVAEDLTHDHSAIFWACIFASHELMKVFGISSAYNMIRKLVNRNLASSEFGNRRSATGDASAINIKKLMKLNAGWAKYHITVLSPPQYDALKSQGVLGDFIAQLQTLHLDELNDRFKALLQLQNESVETGEAFTSSLAYQQLIDRIGMLQGEIIDKNAAPARLDQFASTLLNTHSEGAAEDATEATQLLLSSTFYLLLDKSSGVLRDVDNLRESFLNPTGTEELPAWSPHITLAFTHNDIHEKAQTMSRASGIYSFQQIRQLASRKRRQLADNVADEDESNMAVENSNELPLTDLEEDAPYPFFAELSVHSEVNATFSYAYSFIICDVKIRKGPFGDDESYRTHGVLMKLLPRGLVFVQHQVTRTIYRGLFSLKKFYGKEGMEDDGFGLNVGELNFKLHQHMKKAEHVMLMEKVNGRAGSCRFFRYQHDDYVIVGTKLAHTIGKIDREKKTIILCDDFASFVTLKESSSDVIDQMEDVIEDVMSSNSKGGKIDYEKIEFNRNHLIFSNVTALTQSINWECFDELLQWFGGCTINGEILDPQEMHLVIIDQLQWVVLCTTSFPSEEFSFGKKGMVTAHRDVSDETKDEVVSLVSTLQSFNKYFLFTPHYTLHNLHDIVNGTTEAEVISTKIQKTMELAKELIFERCSEGKVLYLLDGKSRVLEMMKYKTWWYIYRRSIREVVSKLLNRYFNPQEPSKSDEKTKRASSVEEQLTRLKEMRDKMSKAKNLSTNPVLQSKLQVIVDQIRELENPVTAVPLHRPPLKPLVDEIQTEIKNRWTTKFSFLKNEMTTVYNDKVSIAIDLAQKFVEFIHQGLLKDEREVVLKFRKQYPLIWEDFLKESHIQNDV